MASVFLLSVPLEAKRYVRVRERRTRNDFAEVIRELCDQLYPDAQRIVLVMDQLNTHNIASLYQAFTPAEARRLAEKLEIHLTPKHGGWLNMAEIELSVLSRQCLKDYFETRQQLTAAVVPWERSRNENGTGIDWRFTTADARIKLKKLYPTMWPLQSTSLWAVPRLVPRRGEDHAFVVPRPQARRPVAAQHLPPDRLVHAATGRRQLENAPVIRGRIARSGHVLGD